MLVSYETVDNPLLLIKEQYVLQDLPKSPSRGNILGSMSSSSSPIKRESFRKCRRKKKESEGSERARKRKKISVGFPRFSFLSRRSAAFRSRGWQWYNLNVRSDLYLFPPRSRRDHSTNGHAGNISKLNLTAENVEKRPRATALFVSLRVFYQNLDGELCPSAVIIAARIN